jgi:hypothetical protein
MWRMVPKTPNHDEHLLPAKHGKGDLFICDVADAVLKDLIPQMEHPFYSLSKKPETAIRRYEHNGNWLEIVPSVKGLATIYDKDILIYCISQLMEKLKRNEPVGHRVRITSHDLLVFTNRGTAGKDYQALCEALDRLAGTRIKTNIRTGDEEQLDSFGLIDAASIRRKHGLDGRLLGWKSSCLTGSSTPFAVRKCLPSIPITFGSASRLNGGFTNWRASIAAGKPPGRSRLRPCSRNRGRKARSSVFGNM